MTATLDEAQANARLIAALPDMLAALRDAHCLLMQIDGSQDIGDPVFDTLAAIRVAIARATGGV